MNKSLNELTLTEVARALRTRNCSVQDVWDACHRTAVEKNPSLNAFIEIFDADPSAIAQAQKRIDENDTSLLCGIPVAIKDNILIEGHRASAGSKMLEKYVATYDATVIKKLKNAGALFLGRTNMDEFAMGSSTEHSAYGATKNPLDTTRIPGGSSGGSAVAVAAHIVPVALGSDTGGSIRQPASHTGLCGLKPSYGRVSRYGLIALGSSLDQIGPFTRTIEDMRAVFSVLQGSDDHDATSRLPMQSTETFKKRIGVPHHLLTQGVAEDVQECFAEALAEYKKSGYEIVDISLPTSDYALPAYYVIQPAEASANLARFDGVRYGNHQEGDTLLDDYLLSRTTGFGTETTRRILLGTFVLSSGYIDAYYYKALDAVASIKDEYLKAFEQCDIIAFPTVTAPAFRFGEKADPVAMYLEDIFTVTANLTGFPALSAPMGTVKRDGVELPVGFHLTAKMDHEDDLFVAGEVIAHIVQ